MNIQSSAGPNSKFKNIEGLVVYVSPDTTDERIIEFKNFIVLQSGEEITLTNGLKIQAPIVETDVPPVVNPVGRSGNSAPSSVEKNANEKYVIKIDKWFCNNPISNMSTSYALKGQGYPNYMTLFALSKDGDKDILVFLITIAIKKDISGKTEDYSLWIEALCSDQTNEFKGGSNLLRLVLALCKMFNTRTSFKFVNSYLEALSGVEQTYRTLGFNETDDIVPDDSQGTSLKKIVEPDSSTSNKRRLEDIVTSQRKDRKAIMESNFANADIDSLEQENKLVDYLESGDITWIIDRDGDRTQPLSSKGGKSRRRKRRKTIRKRKPRKSRKSRKYRAK